jgi:hypothetical protein
LSLFGLVVSASGPAAACCDPVDDPSPRSQAQHAHAVFRARVLAFEVDENFGSELVRLEVLEVWKGDVGAEIVLDAEGGGSCADWVFPDEGEELIVYLHDDQEGTWINNTVVGDDMAEHEEYLERRYGGCGVSPSTGWRGLGWLVLVAIARRRRAGRDHCTQSIGPRARS